VKDRAQFKAAVLKSGVVPSPARHCIGDEVQAFYFPLLELESKSAKTSISIEH